jgi:alpha-galactosidase
MKVDEMGVLLHLYYGKKISGTAEHLIGFFDRGFSGNPYDAKNNRTYSLDYLPQEFPSAGTGDYRNVAFKIQNPDGSESCDLRFEGYEISNGKYSLQGLPCAFAEENEGETLVIKLVDKFSKIRAELLFGVIESKDIITRSAKIVNTSSGKIVLKKASSVCLDFLFGEFDAISFFGRHAMERNFQRTKISHGTFSIGSRRGTSSHQYNPGVIVAEKNASEDSGACYGILFVYSGGFLFEAEKDQFDQTRVLMGLQSDGFEYPLNPGETFLLPEAALSFSAEGFSRLSLNFHDFIRHHILRGKFALSPRPVLVNSWEAAYFDFSGKTILSLAEEAKNLGIDLVVMDDGWFGERNDDNTSLGDWTVNEKKLGGTLANLIRAVNEKNVKFGIWIEPEMISEESELYKNHPDFAMQIPGRKPVRSRNQLVLDFSRKEVRDTIFDAISKVLDEGNVEYVKWDMNRSLCDFYSAERVPGKVLYDYVLGVYDFAEKLIQKYPDILFEGCSGGGGRFDCGMLFYTPQIWCSDNTDAIDRLSIQYGTSFFYPPFCAGSHVSAVPNHQTGRSVNLHTRGTVAMAGSFGYELNLKKLSAEEKDEIKNQVAFYKKNESLVREGDYFRLSEPAENFAAWEFVSRDKKKILFSAVITQVHGNMTVSFVRLKGLDEFASYREKNSGRIFSAGALMNAGFPLPREMGENLSYIFEFEKCR